MNTTGLELIRRRPDLYLPGGNVTGDAICSCLSDDALGLGATHVRVESINNWHMVAADADWLRLPEDRQIPLDQLFVGIYVYPKRINGMRAEVLVGAFADAAYVATPGEPRRVIGETMLPDAVSRVVCPPPCVRGIAFHLATANSRWSGRDA
jgi:hypothetical protein